MIIPTTEKYIIFLHPRFFSKSLFSNMYKNIKNNLENKGIVVFNIKTAISEIKKYYESIDNQDIKSVIKNKLSFDDNPFPNTNILYINLFNGQYYNDSIYIKKKVENEREMLILLAGKLGVKTINYETEITKTIISKTSASLNVKGFKNGIHYNKEVSRKEGINGKEEYLNRGAPSYLKSANINKIDEEIKNTLGSMKSNVFNYDFYKNNPKLESFVYKRFEFKMLKLEYTIDTEDISDISFVVKSCFVDYGMNISFDKTVTYNETIKYTLEFFDDASLKKAYFNANQAVKDPFYIIREQYDCSDDKDLAVQYITEYVTKLAKKLLYKNKQGYGITNNFGTRLNEFINTNQEGIFEEICSSFRSSLQIKNWIYKNLSDESFEIIDEEYNNNNIRRGDTAKNRRMTNDEIHGFAVSSRSNDVSEIHGVALSPRNNNYTQSQNITKSCSPSTPETRRARRIIEEDPKIQQEQLIRIQNSAISEYKACTENINAIQAYINKIIEYTSDIDKEIEYLQEQLVTSNDTISKLENNNKTHKQIKIKQHKTHFSSEDIQIDTQDNLAIEKFKNKELQVLLGKKQEQKESESLRLTELMTDYDNMILINKNLKNKLESLGINIESIESINKENKEDNHENYSETNV